VAEIEVNAGASPEVIVEDVNEQVIVEGSGELIVTGTPVVTYVPEPYTPGSSPWVVNGAVAMDYLQLPELAVHPSGALVGYGRVFIKDSTGWPYVVDSSGTELPLYIPEPYTPRNDPWVINGRLSSPGAGAGSERFGAGSVADGPGSVALGGGAEASGNFTIASGADAIAGVSGNSRCTAYGHTSRAAGGQSVAIGDACNASTTRTTTVGSLSSATGVNGTSYGAQAYSRTSNCAAFGSQSDSSAAGATGIGVATKTSGINGVSMGFAAQASHDNSACLGYVSVSTAANRFTVGTIGGSYDKELQIGLGFAAWGSTPPSTRPSKINDPSGGTTIDTEARTAINAIIDVLEGAGLSTP